MTAKAYSCSCWSSCACDSRAWCLSHPTKPSLQPLQLEPLWLRLATLDREGSNIPSSTREHSMAFDCQTQQPHAKPQSVTMRYARKHWETNHHDGHYQRKHKTRSTPSHQHIWSKLCQSQPRMVTTKEGKYRPGLLTEPLICINIASSRCGRPQQSVSM